MRQAVRPWGDEHEYFGARVDHSRYLSGVELDGKPAGVSDGFRAATLVDDGGEAEDDRRLDAGRSEEVGAGEVSDIMGALEEALGARASGMDDALRYALPGEVCDLFDQMVVLEEDRS